MSDKEYPTEWTVGDRLKYLDKNNQWAYGTVTSVEENRVYATLDGYPKAVKGCFRHGSAEIVKVKVKSKKRKD